MDMLQQRHLKEKEKRREEVEEKRRNVGRKQSLIEIKVRRIRMKED